VQTIHSHVFPNGLVLVAEPMRSVESAAFTFLLPAGCVYDGDREGLAGFACDMTMRGAGKRDSRQLIDGLDQLGVERGESVSAAHTSYSGAMLASDLPRTLEIYADVLQRATLPDDQLESSRQVMLQELESVEDDPHHKVLVELRRLHYADPWGRSSQGIRSAIESIGTSDVRQFFGQTFRPNGTILGVAGKVEWIQLRDQVEQLFGAWKPLAEPAIVERPGHTRREHVPFEGQQTHIGIAYSTVPYRHADYYQAWGSVGALSGGMSSRFFTEVREKRGLCYTVYATYQTLRDRASVICYSGTTAERAQETLDVMLAELVRLAEGVFPHEIDRLKARIKSSLIMQQESSAARSSAIARDWYHLERVRALDEVSTNVDALSCESINAYLTQNRPRDFTIVTLGPQPLEVAERVS
jgi:predicted Zn-dependent peptidase